MRMPGHISQTLLKCWLFQLMGSAFLLLSPAGGRLLLLPPAGDWLLFSAEAGISQHGAQTKNLSIEALEPSSL